MRMRVVLAGWVGAMVLGFMFMGIGAGQSAAVPRGGEQSAGLPRGEKKPTLWLIGDSTVRNGTLDNGATAGQWGWGHLLHYYFDESRISIVNDAMGGTSSRSYYESPTLWKLVLARIQAGDFVMMQF